MSCCVVSVICSNKGSLEAVSLNGKKWVVVRREGEGRGLNNRQLVLGSNCKMHRQ